MAAHKIRPKTTSASMSRYRVAHLLTLLTPLERQYLNSVQGTRTVNDGRILQRGRQTANSLRSSRLREEMFDMGSINVFLEQQRIRQKALYLFNKERRLQAEIEFQMNYWKPYCVDDSNKHFQISNLGFRPVADVPKICPRFVQRHGTFTRSNTIVKPRESAKDRKRKNENKDGKTEGEKEDEQPEFVEEEQLVENLESKEDE
ncbi:unnamed protein product [Dimorphilus gyrociliatus]|uniref:Uncharacterized protein n=1 Tax=Dimorphilus gyrociliatus TaxID=2664684 RepID=A0A7I8WB21_9ANNE|nr:unnamed protein product [Dimorphilus gyrociliatus]